MSDRAKGLFFASDRAKGILFTSHLYAILLWFSVFLGWWISPLVLWGYPLAVMVGLLVLLVGSYMIFGLIEG